MRKQTYFHAYLIHFLQLRRCNMCYIELERVQCFVLYWKQSGDWLGRVFVDKILLYAHGSILKVRFPNWNYRVLNDKWVLIFHFDGPHKTEFWRSYIKNDHFLKSKLLQCLWDFENSKMVKWAYKVQKLTEIQQSKKC